MKELEKDPAPPPVPSQSERVDDAIVATYIHNLARGLE
jgi:hypothetical protein